MKNNKKEITLCTVTWPSWILLFFPNLWLFDVIAPFIVNNAVLLLALCAFRVADKKQWYKKNIIKVYAFSLASYALGIAYMLLLYLGLGLFKHGTDLFLTASGLLVSAAMIFVFDYFITFKKADKKLKLKLSLALAVFTAPYAFIVPADMLMFMAL